MRKPLLCLAVLALLAACAPAADPGPPPGAAPTPAEPLSPMAEPTTAQPAEPARTPARELVQIPGADGLSLHGVLFTPAFRPAPGVLLLHMYGRSAADWEVTAEALQQAGLAALALDLRGHGRTGGAEDWRAAIEDTALALAWLRAHPATDGRPLAIVGASIGANLALVAGAADPQVAALALLSPGFDYFRLGIEGVVESYGARPLFLAAAQDDPYSAATVEALAAAAAGPVDLVVYSVAGHGTAMLAAAPELPDRLLEFLVGALGG